MTLEPPISITQFPDITLSRYNQLMELLLADSPLEQMLHELILIIQEKQPDCLGSVLLVSEDGQHLLHGAAPDLPQFYNDAVHGITVSENLGSCGAAAHSGRLVIVDDIAIHPNWRNFRDLANRANLRACWSQPIIDNHGKVLGTFGMYYTEVRYPTTQELHLIQEAARLAQLMIEFRAAQSMRLLSQTIAQHLPLGLMITDADYNILEVNPAFLHITGYKEADLLGKTPELFLKNREQRKNLSSILRNLPQKKSWTTEVHVTHRNGERFNAELCFSAVRNDNHELERCIALLSDISERKRSEETIQYQANYDLLTNLPNRNFFYNRLNWMLEQSRHIPNAFSLMLIDLDYFKEINDTLGHEAGDELLVKIGNRLQQCLNKGDLVARLGGDEFGLLISGEHSNEELETIAQHLIAMVANPIAIRNIRDCSMTSSLGIARYPKDGSTVEQLLKAAEHALYSAKANQRGHYAFFTPDMLAEAQTQAMLHQEMRHAVSGNQLRLHYQPVKQLSSEKIIHFEALVRWDHPQRGLIPPDVFIPLAEKTGLIREIGLWVREEALAMIKRMGTLGHKVCIAVNVSTAEFLEGHLAEQIIKQVGQSGVPRGSLMVEITESLLIRNRQATRDFLSQLQRSGIRVALDDFGTGFSSLSYLAEFPADKLKIDRSFIHGMSHDPRKQALVESIITLGHNLGMSIIAEGVETATDETLLKQRGCDCTQGYLLARPMPEHELVTFIEQYAPGLRTELI